MSSATATTLTSKVRRHCSAGLSAMVPSGPMPAECTSTSRGSMPATASARAAKSVSSTGHSPAPRRSAATASSAWRRGRRAGGRGWATGPRRRRADATGGTGDERRRTGVGAVTARPYPCRAGAAGSSTDRGCDDLVTHRGYICACTSAAGCPKALPSRRGVANGSRRSPEQGWSAPSGASVGRAGAWGAL